MSLTISIALMGAVLHQTPPTMTEPRLMRTPAIYGDTIVFSYAGDLWVTKTGENTVARRLTSSPGVEIRPHFSPDGKWIAFNAQYDGMPDVYVIPTEGGEPKRLTFDSNNEGVLGWTPDGKIAYSSIDGSVSNRQPRLWYVDPKGGLPIWTPVGEVAELTFLDGGKRIAYNRENSYLFNWRRYRGGTQGKIGIYDFAANTYHELPSKREQSYFPMAIGHEVYYISDKNLNTLNLYRYDLDSNKDEQLTQYTDADVRWPSTDGKSIVWERDGFLWVYDVSTGKIVKQSPKIISENLHSRPALKKLATQISGADLSPSGARLVVEARGELFSVPAKTGETRNLTRTSGAREQQPSWSPDGKTIAYLSDKSGNVEVYSQPQMGGEETQLTMGNGVPYTKIQWAPDSRTLEVRTATNELQLLDTTTKLTKLVTKGDFGVGDSDFSPDSKWLAYEKPGANGLGALYLYNLESGNTTQVDDGSYDDTGVAFDQNGKYLYFTSARTFSPGFGLYEFSLKVEDAYRIYVMPLQATTADPLVPPDEEEVGRPEHGMGPGGPGGPGGPEGPPSVKIDLDGLAARALPLPMSASRYAGLASSMNGVIYIEASGVPTLGRFDLGSRENQTIGPVLGGLAFNASHTKAAMMGPGGIAIIDVRPGPQAPSRVDTSGVEAVIDPKAEWKEIFWDAWRYERDHYYDPKMRGLNWKAIGDHYATYLEYVNDRSDLSYVLGQMIGELGTGHSYVQNPPDLAGVAPVPIGTLGADYEVSNGFVKFKKIYRGENFDESRKAPLADPGVDVKDGDYLLEIDGHPVTSTTNPAEFLLDKVGKIVTLTVNSSPTKTGSHTVRVRPIGNDANLRYVDFVERSRAKVTQMSGGRIGYMHIPNTSTEGAVAFIQGFYSQTDKDAVIVDERWNGGGYIQPWFVDTLARKPRAGIENRNTADGTEAVAIEGPKAMLINEYAGSGGDFFPYMFRQAKLGPLIGKRTWGGLVGIAGFYSLIDGGGITAPEFAIFDRQTGNIIAENNGLDPDIDVDARPDLIAKGEDPQLEAAVKYLMDQIKNTPPHQVKRTMPKVAPPGNISGG